jgi:hypothetical protein
MGWTSSAPGYMRKTCFCFFSKNLMGRDMLEDISVGRIIILKLVLKKQGLRVWTGLS